MGNIKDATTKVIHNGERVVNEGSTEQSAIAYCESNYPEMMDEYKRIMWEQYEMFCKKQRYYGPGNITGGTSLEKKDGVGLTIDSHD